MRIDLKDMGRRVRNRLSDELLAGKLILEFNSLARERAREGPWLKDIHIPILEDHKIAYEKKHSQDPDFEERHERVFSSVVNSYFRVLRYHSRI